MAKQSKNERTLQECKIHDLLKECKDLLASQGLDKVILISINEADILDKFDLYSINTLPPAVAIRMLNGVMRHLMSQCNLIQVFDEKTKQITWVQAGS